MWPPHWRELFRSGFPPVKVRSSANRQPGPPISVRVQQSHQQLDALTSERGVRMSELCRVPLHRTRTSRISRHPPRQTRRRLLQMRALLAHCPSTTMAGTVPIRGKRSRSGRALRSDRQALEGTRRQELGHPGEQRPHAARRHDRRPLQDASGGGHDEIDLLQGRDRRVCAHRRDPARVAAVPRRQSRRADRRRAAGARRRRPLPDVPARRVRVASEHRRARGARRDSEALRRAGRLRMGLSDHRRDRHARQARPVQPLPGRGHRRREVDLIRRRRPVLARCTATSDTPGPR